MLFKQGRNREEPARRGGKAGTPSLLSSDVSVEGDIVVQGDLYIGGSVTGRVVAHKLTVGESGSISGLVEADTAVIAGSVSGKLTAGAVTLKRTANVSADITHVSLTIESGGSFEGFSRRVEHIQAPEAPAKPVSIEAPFPVLGRAEPELA